MRLIVVKVWELVRDGVEKVKIEKVKEQVKENLIIHSILRIQNEILNEAVNLVNEIDHSLLDFA